MIPEKILLVLGYNNLALMLDQERKHWLMKTDKKKQIQDKHTGELFQGQVDNIGTDIILETEKLPTKNDVIINTKFRSNNTNYILSVDYSAFPFSAGIPGMMMCRIVSMNYPTNVNGEVKRNNYKIRFTNTSEVIIPFGGSLNSDEIFADRWLMTTTPPSILVLNEQTKTFYEAGTIEFIDDVENVVYYYPLTESLQPLDITSDGRGNYETATVNSDNYIGYPLLWFSSDSTQIGPGMNIEDNYNSDNEQLVFITNAGNSSKYNAVAICDVAGDLDATPDGTDTTNYVIRAHVSSDVGFDNTSRDFVLDLSTVEFYNNDTDETYEIKFVRSSDNDRIYMNSDVPWEYVDETTYEISMEYFDSNCIKNSSTPLIPFVTIHFDESIIYTNNSSDIGWAGIRMASSNLTSDIYPRYPHDLNKWDGLPEWMNELEDDAVPQHMSIYALHNTPTYIEDQPDSRQVAALLLDPGLPKTETIIDEDGNIDRTLTNDQRGRIYVLSNDDTEYKNNAKETYPKPDRTVARICDIPTSVMELSGISGLSPTSIVDKKYVRSEASYTVEDKNILYNTLATRWVRPTALNSSGVAICDKYHTGDEFTFRTWTSTDGTFTNTLDEVDLINHNNFRIWENLNPMVDVTQVSAGPVTEGGTDYVVGDIGLIVVGGFSFTYEVTEIDEDTGAVTGVSIGGNEDVTYISLSNFDMSSSTSGLTSVYGTSPTTGIGRGLKMYLRIDIDHYNEIQTYQGDIYPDLFAIVRESDGLWIYRYELKSLPDTIPHSGSWVKNIKISDFEESSTIKKVGGLSTQDAYLNSIIPSLRTLEIAYKNDNEELTAIDCFQTASFINIIDKDVTPVLPVDTGDDDVDTSNVVDINKFYTEGIQAPVNARGKSTTSVVAILESMDVYRYDSYIFWRWLDEDDNSNLLFEYGIVHRAFNNLQTTDSHTMLPKTKLNCDNYVHTNMATTVVWNVDGVGPMVWAFSPDSSIHEEYHIDAETRDLHVSRTRYTWESIDVRNSSTGEKITFVDEDGKMTWNIMTNNAIVAPGDDSTDAPIYQQPKMTQIISKGDSFSSLESKYKYLFGMWHLVYPRIQTFTIKDDVTNTEWTPIKMQMIKASNIGALGDVLDEYGNRVNRKTLIVDETSSGLSAKMYNAETSSWEKL